jgi:tetratricopeptide (TPR) repeat protein
MLARYGLTFTLLLSSVYLSAQLNPASRSLGHQAEEVHVVVNVHTATGQPADNARVELRQSDMGSAAITGYTNTAGVADITGVPAGNYVVVVNYKLVQAETHENLAFGERELSLTLPTDTTGADRGSSTSVSVADYKVPDKARKEYGKAQAALAKGKQDETLSHLNKALETYPHYADALTLRAIIRMDKQDSTAALSDLNAAIQADPSCSLAYFAMGSVYNAMERFPDAELALQRGLTLDPKSWQGYFELGKALVGKGDYQAGIAQLEKSQEFSGGKYPPIHLVKAHAMLALKQYPGAMKELQAFITEAPNDQRSTSAKETLDRVNAFVEKGSVASK